MNSIQSKNSKEGITKWWTVFDFEPKKGLKAIIYTEFFILDIFPHYQTYLS